MFVVNPQRPQVITGSHDSTIRLWDLRTAKTMNTLTFHKKSVRAMAAHPHEFTFSSASAENIKKFKLPEVRCCLMVAVQHSKHFGPCTRRFHIRFYGVWCITLCTLHDATTYIVPVGMAS